MNYEVINLNEQLSAINELWSPKVVGEIHDVQFKLIKIDGDFEWHEHDGVDKVFIVLEGEMFIAFRDGQVKISKGEMFIVLGDPRKSRSPKRKPMSCWWSLEAQQTLPILSPNKRFEASDC